MQGQEGTGMDIGAEELFERFKQQEGKSLNDAYEEAKETLRLNKIRHKDIVTLLNNQKTVIDTLTSQLADLDLSFSPISSPVAEEGRDGGTESANEKAVKRGELEGLLEEAKRSYRSAHTEMKLCKDQVAETQSLKKRAMASLLHHFAEYQAAMKLS